MLAMAVVEAGHRINHGLGGHLVKRGVGYGEHGNGHGYGLNTDKNMRRYEDKHFGSFGQYGLHSKLVSDYCSDNYCLQYPH